MMDRIEYDFLFDEIKKVKEELEKVKNQEEPVFKFALREDLKNELQFLPTRAEQLSTGYDVRAAQEDRKPIIIHPGHYAKITLGFRSFCPDGWWYHLHPRSSSFAKKYMHSLVGTVDESWEGITQLSFQYQPDQSQMIKDLVINFGDPIGQIIPIKRINMKIVNISNQDYNNDCLNRNASRKDGGFGSTDLRIK